MPQVQYPTPVTRSSPSEHTLTTYEHLEEEKDEEEDFQIISFNDEHWMAEEIPDRPLCIHEHSLPYGLCPYPYPYADYQTPSYFKMKDLNDISKFEDLMTTSSGEDIPALKDSVH